MSAALALLLLAANAGCAGVPPVTVVEIDADSTVRGEAAMLALTVLEGADRVPRRYHEIRDPDLAWPIVVDLVVPAAPEEADLRIVARAETAGGARVSWAMVHTRHRSDGDGFVRLTLDAGCAEARCSEADDQTCHEGACVPAASGEASPL